MHLHGRWRIQRFGKSLLVAQVFESWNELAFLKFSQDLEAEIRAMNSDKWAYIGDARDWGLAVPDSQTPLEELYLGVTGLVCNVTVISNSLQQTVMDQMKSPGNAKVAPHFYASSITETLDILEKYDIHVDRSVVERWFELGRA